MGYRLVHFAQGIWLALSLIAISGCADRSSPAAPPSQAATAPPGVATSTAAPAGEPSAAKSEHASGPTENQRVRDITFDTVKFDIQKEQPFQRAMLTPAIEKLENAPIRIRGFILPSFQQSGLTQFVLVRDNMECCFGPGAAIYDCIVVEMTPGKTAEFSTRPVAVEGVFSVRELKADDRWLAVYHIDADNVH